MPPLSDINIRPLAPETDVPDVVELISSITGNPFSVDRFTNLLDGPAEKALFVAVDPEQVIIAYCAIVRPQDFPPGRYSLWLGVHPDHRRQTIGTRLLHESLQMAPVKELGVDIPDTRPDALGFARRVGFTVERRRIRSFADPADVTPDTEAETTLRSEGIDFRNLLELGDTDENRRKVYELNKKTSSDIPGRGPFYSYDRYLSTRFDTSGYHPEGVIVALDRSRFVGFTQITGDGRSMFLQMTGVDRDYRGRKIGRVLRDLAIRFARTRGANEVRTVIDSENAAMLALNRRMGFVDDGETFVLSLKTHE